MSANVEKHITPILLIVVALVALVSTFAWFSVNQAAISYTTFNSGSSTSFSLTQESGFIDGVYTAGEEDYYQGQKGFDEEGNQYPAADSDAPYGFTYNLMYRMSSGSAVNVRVSLDKVIITLGETYNYSLQKTIDEIIVGSHIEAEYLDQYYSTSIDSLPSGIGASDFYCVCTQDKSQVTHFVINGSLYTSEHFYLDYWESTVSGVERNGIGYVSARVGGVTLPYMSDENAETTTLGGGVTAQGRANYIGIYIGFFGKDTNTGVYNKQFLFSDPIFQGSIFDFELSAGA